MELEAHFAQLIKSSAKGALLSMRTKSWFLVKVVGKEKKKNFLLNCQIILLLSFIAFLLYATPFWVL